MKQSFYTNQLHQQVVRSQFISPVGIVFPKFKTKEILCNYCHLFNYSLFSKIYAGGSACQNKFDHESNAYLFTDLLLLYRTFISLYINGINIKIYCFSVLHQQYSLRKKCPYSDLFWSVFSRIKTPNTTLLFCLIFKIFNDTHRGKLFFSIQYKNDCLVAPFSNVYTIN